MLDSLFKSKGSNDSERQLMDLLNNLLSSNNAKVTIKFETGKNKNMRDVNGNMVSEDTRTGLNPEVQDILDDLSGGLFNTDTLVEGGAEPTINRSPYSNDVLDKLNRGEEPHVSVPLSLLLDLASNQINSPQTSFQDPLLSLLMGGGGAPSTPPVPPAAPGTPPTPSAGLPFLEGMPMPEAGGGAPMPPLPPEEGAPQGNIDELIKQMLGGMVGGKR